MRFINHNKRIVFLVLVLTCVGLFFLSEFFKINILEDGLGTIIIPTQKFFVSSFNWVSDKFRFIANMSDIEKQNTKLKQKMKTYNLDLERLKILELENKKLNDLLDLKNSLECCELTAANVIAKDNSNWFSIFVIDKGLLHGLKKNMVVLSNKGLVGRIIDCKSEFSKVLSIVDEKSSVSIKNFRSGDLGFARGNLKLKNSGLCLLEFLDENAEIAEGDEIITSHLSDIFPKGLLVGRIQKINLNKNQTQKEIILEPASNLKNLEHVLVIKKVLFSQEEENMLQNFSSGE